ncbi:MAG: hypothetical protein R3Y65_08295 [Bacillota bacterium]
MTKDIRQSQQNICKNQKPPFAIIDMGSNSFRLCIFDDSKVGADKKLKYVETCRMGEGFHENLEIQPIPFERCVKTCEKFVEICNNYGVLKIYSFATATVREAVNRESFLSACKNLGLDIHILSGEQEALCGFLGASGGLDFDDISDDIFDDISDIKSATDVATCNADSMTCPNGSDVAILDIGGASTEVAIGNIQGFKGLFSGKDGFPSIEEIREKSKGTYMGLESSPIKFSHSFKVGAVRLTDKFSEDFQAEKAFLKETFAVCKSDINLENTVLLGIGGTITALCGLIAGCENYNPQLHGFSASTAEIQSLSSSICSMTKTERASLPHLKDKRKEIIAAGGVLLASALEFFNASSITASLTDNIEGYREYLGV